MTRRIFTALASLALVIATSVGFAGAAGASTNASGSVCSAFGSYLAGLTGASAQAVRAIQQSCAAETGIAPNPAPNACVVPSANYATIASAFGDTNCAEVDLTNKSYSPVGIDVTHDVTLVGNGARLGRSNAGAVFFVEPGVSFTVQDVIFKDAWYGSHAITNYGTLDVTRSLFVGSIIANPGAPAPDGGAIMDFGDSATITLSLFANELGSLGGAVAHESLGALTIQQSAFIGNGQGVSVAGAVYSNGGTTDIEQSLFAYNHSIFGQSAVVIFSGSYTHSGNIFWQNS